MPTKVLVTGATGFTGSYVVPRLLERRFEVCCLVRPSSDTSVLPCDRVNVIPGDLNDRGSTERAMRGVDVLVNLASLGFGHAANIVRAALDSGVRRAVFISTTAIYTALSAESKSVRLAAEDAISQSCLAYSILRPTMIYGGPRDRNMSRLIRFLQRWPVIPVFGDGQSLQQPVYVGDVAGSVLHCLESDVSVGKSYNVPGASALTFDQVIDTVCEAIRRRVMKVHVPSRPVAAALALLESLSIRLPVSSEQVRRLNEDKVFEYSDATRDFGYRPRTFREGILLELREMGLR